MSYQAYRPVSKPLRGPGRESSDRNSSMVSDIRERTPSAMDTSRWVPSPVVALATRAAQMAATAWRPPAALSATVAPGSAGPPPASRPEQWR